MILSGQLEDFSLPDILQLLLQQKKTGNLTLTRGKEKSEISLSQGTITSVRNGLQNPENKIREMLIESGRISSEDFQLLQNLSQQVNRPLLTTLVAKGHATEEEKESWLQLAAEDMICDLFAWTEGHYDFTTGQKSQAGFVQSISTEFACMEGMRRIDDWPRLKESLPEDTLVFRKISDIYNDGDDQSWEHALWEKINGRKTLKQLEKEMPFGTFRLYEMILGLWNRGHIEPAEQIPHSPETSRAKYQPSEKEHKTTLVLGVAGFIFVCALLMRFIIVALWGGSTLLMNQNQARIEDQLKQENIEALLIDYAYKNDNFPKNLAVMVKEDIFAPRELKNKRGREIPYRKINDREFEFK